MYGALALGLVHFYIKRTSYSIFIGLVMYRHPTDHVIRTNASAHITSRLMRTELIHDQDIEDCLVSSFVIHVSTLYYTLT